MMHFHENLSDVSFGLVTLINQNYCNTRKFTLRGHILAPSEGLHAPEFPGVDPGGRLQESWGDSKVWYFSAWNFKTRYTKLDCP